jgi:putative chitinase
MTKINRKAFFDHLRDTNVLGPVLTAEEVSNTENLLDATEAAGWLPSWIAYGLATAYHETAHTMAPVSEFGGDAYFTRMYDITGNRPAMARKHGNTIAGDGIRFRGRGHVQLTWRDNYKKAGAFLKLPLEQQPDLAMDGDVSARILVWGMQTGSFTGKALRDYLPGTFGTLKQFVAARRIINGVDKARLIADYAMTFQVAVQS